MTSPPEHDEPDPRAGLAALLLAAPVLAAVPALRLGGPHTAGAVVVYAGALVLLAAPAAWLRRAVVAGPALKAALLGVGLAVVPWMLLGQLLKAATHHRPLGAATFAVLGGAVLLGAVACARRLFAVAEQSRFGRALRSAGAALGGGAVLVALLRGHSTVGATTLLDLGLLVGAAGAAGFGSVAPLARWSPVGAGALVVGALLLARGALSEAAVGASWLAWPVRLLP